MGLVTSLGFPSNPFESKSQKAIISDVIEVNNVRNQCPDKALYSTPPVLSKSLVIVQLEAPLWITSQVALAKHLMTPYRMQFVIVFQQYKIVVCR